MEMLKMVPRKRTHAPKPFTLAPLSNAAHRLPLRALAPSTMGEVGLPRRCRAGAAGAGGPAGAEQTLQSHALEFILFFKTTLIFTVRRSIYKHQEEDKHYHFSLNRT